ncbi:MAG TPA: hypothetical protein VG408_10830, partial [Actinomycetota bacterium]|nr:hypothetical protein [Actinomycetota bacterium]
MASAMNRHRPLVAILSILILALFMAPAALADHSEDSERGRGHNDECARDKDDHDGRDYDD